MDRLPLNGTDASLSDSVLSNYGHSRGVERQFSEAVPELMDLPNLDAGALRRDLESIGRLNRVFGAKKELERIFFRLAGKAPRVTLLDLASGYGDHGRNLIRQAQARGQEAVVVALDHQLTTLQISRRATPAGQKVFFVQADARQLPFRRAATDLVFCTLALHHFGDGDAGQVLAEMARVARRGLACVDLARSRVAVFFIDLLATIVMREPMVKHDARLSIRRAFNAAELRRMTAEAGWPEIRQTQFLWFQQAVTGCFKS